MKRFYKIVGTKPVTGGYAVLLDGRGVQTPARYPLILPTEELALAIAAEWRGQEDEVMATSMPLLRLANTVIDGVAANRDQVIEAVLRFGANDLICYRAHQPPDLVARQREAWDPWLDWARQQLGAHLAATDGLTHIDQTPDAIAALREALAMHDAFTLGALHVVASITGSLVLALAVADRRLTGAAAFELSRIDEAYQVEKWGTDAEAQKRTTNLARELDKAVQLIDSLRS